MSIQKPPPPKRLLIRWATLKGLAAIILFLIIATLIEYAVVLYAINLGVKDTTPLQWTPQFPGTDWILTIMISPLFHLVPIAVIITLLFNWIYLTRHIAVKPHEVGKGRTEFVTKRAKEPKSKKILAKIKSGLLKFKGVKYIWQKIHFARATTKGAFTVLLAFATLIFTVSLLAYPRFVYQTISNAYQNNPSLLGFVKGTSEALSSVGGIFSGVNNVLMSAAPGFRDFCLGLGTIIQPLAALDSVGKYLFLQNMAAWISALTTLFYGEYIRKARRYRKGRS